MSTETFGTGEITEKTRAREEAPGSSYYHVGSVACRSTSRQNEGLRVAERAEQIPPLRTANNSLSVAARPCLKTDGRIYDAISRRNKTTKKEIEIDRDR